MSTICLPMLFHFIRQEVEFKLIILFLIGEVKYQLSIELIIRIFLLFILCICCNLVWSLSFQLIGLLLKSLFFYTLFLYTHIYMYEGRWSELMYSYHEIEQTWWWHVVLEPLIISNGYIRSMCSITVPIVHACLWGWFYSEFTINWV